PERVLAEEPEQESHGGEEQVKQHRRDHGSDDPAQQEPELRPKPVQQPKPGRTYDGHGQKCSSDNQRPRPNGSVPSQRRQRNQQKKHAEDDSERAVGGPPDLMFAREVLVSM